MKETLKALKRVQQFIVKQAYIEPCSDSQKCYNSAITLAVETIEKEVEALSGSITRLIESSVRIYTRCPSCHNDTLTINKGHLLCTWHECPNPVMIDELGKKGITQEPPLGYPIPPPDPICEPTPADAIPPSSNPNEPVRFGYSREEIYEHAKTFMVETYGPVREIPDKDKWHERYGLLLSFLHDRFPKA